MSLVYIISAECARGKMDTEKIKRFLQVNGIEETRSLEKADYVYIGTCGFTQYAEDQSLKIIEKVIDTAKQNARIIIGGCLPAINQPRLLALGKELIYLKSKDIEDIEAIIAKKAVTFKDFAKLDTEIYIDKGEGGIEPVAQRIRRYFFEFGLSVVLHRVYYIFKTALGALAVFLCGKTVEKKIKDMAMVEISRGCLGNCSYCAIKFAKGRLKSKSLDEIVSEFKRCISSGHERVRLIAAESGCYGMDINTTFVRLMSALINIPGSKELLIDGMHPYWLIKYQNRLIDIFCAYKGRVSFIVSLQSGNNRILNKMNRNYTVEDMKKSIMLMQEKIPRIEFYGNIIAGFPGETSKEFKDTLSLISALNLELLFTFKYSDRPGVEAAEFKDKLSDRVKLKRMWLAEIRQIFVYSRRIFKNSKTKTQD